MSNPNSTYIMRAYHTVSPLGFVYWEVTGTPDTSAAYAPYPSGQLTDTIIFEDVSERGATSYDLPMFAAGLPAANTEVDSFVLPREKSLAVGLANSQFVAQTTATSSATFAVMKNSYAIGSIVFPPATSIGTPSFLSLQSFEAGDTLRVIAPLPQDLTLADIAFTFVFEDYVAQPAPTYAGISPGTGVTIGGTAVAITGTNFLSGCKVTIGGVDQGTITFINSSHISFTAVGGSVGTFDVVVTNPDGKFVDAGSVFTYILPAPVFTSITPSTGSTGGGTSVTVSGNYFVSGSAVYVDGLIRTTTFVNPTTLTLTTPSHAAGAVAIKVVNPDTQFVNTPGAYTFV